jgi:hypothetical protein
MRRENLIEEELFKSDLASEIVLTASGLVLFIPLLVLLVLAFTHTAALQ